MSHQYIVAQLIQVLVYLQVYVCVYTSIEALHI